MNEIKNSEAKREYEENKYKTLKSQKQPQSHLYTVRSDI